MSLHNIFDVDCLFKSIYECLFKGREIEQNFRTYTSELFMKFQIQHLYCKKLDFFSKVMIMMEGSSRSVSF